ncbi:hypothetical protein NQ318_007681, partial [Aromia moschata]
CGQCYEFATNGERQKFDLNQVERNVNANGSADGVYKSHHFMVYLLCFFFAGRMMKEKHYTVRLLSEDLVLLQNPQLYTRSLTLADNTVIILVLAIRDQILGIVYTHCRIMEKESVHILDRNQDAQQIGVSF